jgi:hypothetical protein
MAANPTLITTSDISGLLKNVYTAFREKTFGIATPYLAQVKKGKAGGPRRMRWGGNGVIWDVVLSRPTGMVSSRAGYFGKNSNAIEKQATLGIERTYVTRELDRLAAMGTESKEAAFYSLGRKVVEEALSAARLGQEELLNGAGTGIKGIVASSADTTHCVVTDPYGVSGAGQGGLLLDVGQQIAAYDSTLATLRGRAVITAAVNTGDNVALVLDTAIVGLAATDRIVSCTDSDTSLNAVPNGLINSLNRGGAYASICGLTSATYARWDSTRLVAATDVDADPNESAVWQLIALVAGRSGHDARLNPGEFLLMSTPGIAKKLMESFLGQRRYDAANMMDIKGGFKAVNICGIPLLENYWIPAGTVYLIHVPSMTWVDGEDWQKVQYEDSGAWRFIDGRDANQITFGSYWNHGPLNRIAHGMITGYSDTVRYTHVM